MLALYVQHPETNPYSADNERERRGTQNVTRRLQPLFNREVRNYPYFKRYVGAILMVFVCGDDVG
jgi:hypothetical protein